MHPLVADETNRAFYADARVSSEFAAVKASLMRGELSAARAARQLRERYAGA